MLEVAALAYGVVATFVLSSAGRNRREARGISPAVAFAGWGTMAFSGVTGAMLLAYAACGMATGTLPG